MDLWQSVLNKYFPTVDDRILFTLGTWFVHIAVFWGYNSFLLLCTRNNWFQSKRIEPLHNPEPSLVKECLQKLAVNHFLIQPIALYFVYPYFQLMGLSVRDAIPPWYIIMRDFLVAGVMNDWLFYGAHRMLHHKSIYKYIHKEHHRFKASIGIAAEFAHPVEDVLANLIPTLIGCFVMGSHIVVLWIWLAYRLYETVDTHSGYCFDWSLSQLLPFTGGREEHYFHHSHNVGSYGAVYMDRIFGTDKAFKEYQQKKQQIKAKVEKSS